MFTLQKLVAKQTPKLMISVIFWFTVVCNISAQLPKNDLSVTYVANEGFLLSTSTKKILIDALFTDGYGLFPVPPKETINSIMDDKPPFNNIDLLFLTHYHKDHCDPALMYDYLSKHNNVRLVTNKPSIVFIHGNIIRFILLKKQFDQMTPDVNQNISKTIDGIPVKAFGLQHLSFYVDGINIEENMVNESFLFKMDGIKIFHSGDIKKDALESYLAENKKWTDSIDVAFLYFELFENGEPDLDYILKTMSPKYVFIMHVPLNKIEEWTTRTEQLKAKFKNIFFLKNSMDSETIHLPYDKTTE